jgi:muramoyltetrapeptide carboxypeptidase LdcA involved in peptidoglycan recycling
MVSMTATHHGWSVPLQGETLVRGKGNGVLLGGCITLVETSLGTPWELDTRGSILLLEDRGVKPYQLDRMLLHLRQSGNSKGCAALFWENFPSAVHPRGARLPFAMFASAFWPPCAFQSCTARPSGTPRGQC